MELIEIHSDNEITEQKIRNLGWDKVAYASNGGSIEFSNAKNGDRTWITLSWHGANFIYKNSKDPRLNQVTFTKYSWPKNEEMYTEEIVFQGDVFDMITLGQLMDKFKLD